MYLHISRHPRGPEELILTPPLLSHSPSFASCCVCAKPKKREKNNCGARNDQCELQPTNASRAVGRGASLFCRKSQFSGQTLLEGNAPSHTKEEVLKLKVIFLMDSDLNKGKRSGDRSCQFGPHGMCAAELQAWEKEECTVGNNCITRRVNNAQSSVVYRD